VPIAVGVIAASSHESRRTVIAVNMGFGVVGALAGYGISHRIYWQSHGTDNPRVYTYPAPFWAVWLLWA
jgi:hypothetical protein